MIPKRFVLNENYPNPFNPITTIKYQIPKNGNVRLAIYNIIGQEVITLVNSEQWAGKYSVRWNGTNQYGSQVATGTYFYVLKTNNNQSIKKMLLLK
jgi:flagellar hook assembly protein FlgD